MRKAAIWNVPNPIKQMAKGKGILSVTADVTQPRRIDDSGQPATSQSTETADRSWLHVFGALWLSSADKNENGEQ